MSQHNKEISPPKNDMHIRLMLAESAQIQSGKLFALGGGIAVLTMTVPGFQVIAICGTITLPFEEHNREHELKIELIDADMKPYIIQTGLSGEQPFLILARFSSALSPQLKRGSMGIQPIAIQFALPLREGSFHFRISLNGKERPEAKIPLYIVAAPGSVAQQAPRQ